MYDYVAEIVGLIAAIVAAIVGAIPTSKWIKKRREAKREIEKHAPDTQSMQAQLQHLEDIIQHVEMMLVSGAVVHQAQSKSLESLKLDVARLREDIIAFRIQLGVKD